MPTDEQFRIIAAITVKLAQLGHEVIFVEPITTGPLITTFRFAPKAATKVNQIVNCSQDLALALSAEDIVIRRLPGEAVIGVSVPNTERQPVLWRDLLASPAPFDTTPIPLNFGVDSQGRPFREDLTKLPHLLVAGSTDGGKSTLINGMIAALMYWRQPSQVQFILSDTKRVEFGKFKGSPYLLCDPLKTMYETWEQMDWLIDEVERRLKTLESWRCQKIADYHQRNPQHTMPYIVFVVDELYHILGGTKRGESKIGTDKLTRIAGESRAAGIHCVVGTQRPSVDVVSGSIKANFPARLTFRLPSETDSRTIIGCGGAEHLLARGDMLYCSPNHPATRRLHSGFASQEDIRQCLAYAVVG
jgi:S-DNA-T family DNA segregation ATPase FtsK/SpoIIIE